MTQQQWNSPGGPPPPASGGSSRTAWVAVVVAAAVVLALLVVWALLPRGGDVPAPPSESPDAPPSTAPADPSAPVSDGAGSDDPDPVWGEFPPPNVADLRDLSGAAFPQTVGGAFELTGTKEATGSVMADYDDTAQARSLTVALWSSRMMYASVVDRMDDPAYHGDAVCGQAVDGEWVDTHCVMAGSNSVLQVISSSDGFTPEEMAAIIQELYTSL